MNAICAVAIFVGFGSVAMVLLILAELSKRLGQVIRWPPYYRAFYVSSFLIVVSLAGRLVVWDRSLSGYADEMPNWLPLALSNGPLALGMTLSGVAAWYYWRWLLRSE